MIEKDVVMILGAGASADFGFPLGRRLLTNVVDGIQRRDANLFKPLLGCGFSDECMQVFAQELDTSMQPSVDAFLENRPKFLDIGKAAIAAALIPYEDDDRLQRRRDGGPHWYEYLYQRLAPTREDYDRSKLSIITFNYDRSFEHFLFRSLRASFGLSIDECRPLLKNVPLVHVYGQLGALDYVSGDGRGYTVDLNPKTILKCANEIRIVHEGQRDSSEFRTAWKWLSTAEIVAFLGFGYHKSNVERLQPDLIPEGVPVYGCAYGMMSSEVDGIRPMFTKHRERLQFGGHNHDVLTFLRNNPVLR